MNNWQIKIVNKYKVLCSQTTFHKYPSFDVANQCTWKRIIWFKKKYSLAMYRFSFFSYRFKTYKTWVHDISASTLNFANDTASTEGVCIHKSMKCSTCCGIVVANYIFFDYSH